MASEQKPWFLKSTIPVLFPWHEALAKSNADYDSFIATLMSRRHEIEALGPVSVEAGDTVIDTDESEAFTLVSGSTAGDIRDDMIAMELVDESEAGDETTAVPATTNTCAFMNGLHSHDKSKQGMPEPARNMENMMYTEKGDLTHRSTTNPLLDLFVELEDEVSGPQLRSLLEAAWADDSNSTLRIIFNARSIHLGKGSRATFYRAVGWLAQNQPLTLVTNLKWLVRPVIQKKAHKKDDEDAVLVDAVKEADDPSGFDVKDGGAHGYWKDLLNMLALAANNCLDVLSDPRDVMNQRDPNYQNGKRVHEPKPIEEDDTEEHIMFLKGGIYIRGGEESHFRLHPESPFRHQVAAQKEIPCTNLERSRKRNVRHGAALNAFRNKPVYRALHLSIARLFAEQLTQDLAALRGKDFNAKRNISLCGKWAPSSDRFHDKHTFIVSSIAEVMFPLESLRCLMPDPHDREIYLRYAREEYRKGMSALRNHLDVVERKISARKLQDIRYERVPSIAMKNYTKMFIKKDREHFSRFLGKVATGEVTISGATLLPSTIVGRAEGLELSDDERLWSTGKNLDKLSKDEVLQFKMRQLERDALHAQWNTMVQSIKDSGSTESCIAVCDVSGSMSSPRFPDGTRPIHSAIGLSLLLAEVTQAPFGDSIITFSTEPTVHKVDMSLDFVSRVQSLAKAQWSMSTDFVAVFEKLILPMAKKNNLSNEDMVKRIFVFSDMQFDRADSGNRNIYGPGTNSYISSSGFTTSYERIEKQFKKAGYDMPELVFWNLAGGRGHGTAPKPVLAKTLGTSMVGGYSQAMLKMFLDGGLLEQEEEEEVEEVVVGEDGEEERQVKRVKMDPVRTMRKAIGHKAYDMLKVLD